MEGEEHHEKKHIKCWHLGNKKEKEELQKKMETKKNKKMPYHKRQGRKEALQDKGNGQWGMCYRWLRKTRTNAPAEFRAWTHG